MKAFAVGLIAALSLSLVAPDARAQCADWLPGPLDSGTAPNGANSTVSASIVWNSKLVIGGHFTSVEGMPVGYIAARDPVTGLWDDLAGGMGDLFFPNVQALMVYDGDLIAAGTFDSAGGVSVSNIARWDGSSWNPLGTGLDGMVRTLFIYNNELIAGGEFANAGGALAEGVARWDGSSWHALGGGVSGAVFALGFYAGDLYVGGTIDDASGLPVSGIARWNGSAWSAVSTGLQGYAYAFSLFNGDLIVGGFFDAAGGVPAKSIASWNGSSFAPLGTGIGDGGGQIGTVDCITNISTVIYVGGTFVTAGGIPTNNIARWNFGWQGIGSGTNTTVNTITSLGNETIAGGTFTTAGSATAMSLARWDGTYWGSFGGGTAGLVSALVPYNGRIVAGGDFHQSTLGQVAHNLVGFDGISMRPFTSGVNGLVEALESFKYPGLLGDFELVVGGQFTVAGGLSAPHIARWREDPQGFPAPHWQAMGAGFNDRVTAIERFNNETYAGGTFTASGATATSRVARWNPTTSLWEAMGNGMNGPVYALMGYNGSLYAGGSFTTASGLSTGGLARWTGSSWTSVAGIFSGTVLSLEVHDGKLLIGGTFAGVGGSPNIVQYDGISIAGVGTGGTNGSGVTSLRSTGSRLYAGGEFTTVGGVSASGVAYYDGTWHGAAGGVDFPPVMALGLYHGEVQVGGLFTQAGSATTRAWARFAETGAPWIVHNPGSLIVQIGTTATFNVDVATGYTPTYAWRKDDVPVTNGPTGHGSVITGATTKTLVISSARPDDQGAYTVTLSNACGSAVSFPAQLTVEGTVDVASTDLPGTTALESIGPNPAGGPTTIAFRLGDEAHAIMRIFDVSGRLVRALDEGHLSAGPHRTTWDARSSQGSAVAAGIYFVTLEVDGRKLAVERLVMLR